MTSRSTPKKAKMDNVAGNSSPNLTPILSPGTPNKTNPDFAAASPSSKASLSYNFWDEKDSKVPKDFEEDKEDFCKLDELKICQLSKKAVKVFGIKTIGSPNCFKMACEDSSGMMTFAAFQDAAIRLPLVITAGKWYKISNFRVAEENKEYLTGALNNLQMTFKDHLTQVEEIKNCDENARQPTFISIEEVKNTDDNTLVDVLCVCVKDWGQSISANGSTRWQVTLTDKTKECIRLTIWDKVGQHVLVGVEGKTILVKYANVTSFEGIKNLQTKWFSIIEMQPAMDESYDLQKWFDEQKTAD